MELPEGNPTRDEIIDSYIKTLTQVVGSKEEARMKIYSVSTKHYFAFGCLVSEELSYKIKCIFCASASTNWAKLLSTFFTFSCNSALLFLPLWPNLSFGCHISEGSKNFTYEYLQRRIGVELQFKMVWEGQGREGSVEYEFYSFLPKTKGVKASFEESFKAGKNRWFFTKLRF